MKTIVPFLFPIFIIIADAIVLNSSLVESKIINGLEANFSETMYMVSLQAAEPVSLNLNMRAWKHFCGAGMISWKIVLTSAFCTLYMEDVGGDEFKFASAVVGTVNLSCGGKRYGILKVKRHPRYKNDEHEPGIAQDHDLAVVMLETEIKSIHGSLLHIPKVDVPSNTFATIAGWGSDQFENISVGFKASRISPILHVMRVVTLHPKYCSTMYPSINFKLWQSCAIATGYKKTSWKDMGSPLITDVLENGKIVKAIIGVVCGGTHKVTNIFVRFIKTDVRRLDIEEMIDELETNNGSCR